MSSLFSSVKKFSSLLYKKYDRKKTKIWEAATKQIPNLRIVDRAVRLLQYIQQTLLLLWLSMIGSDSWLDLENDAPMGFKMYERRTENVHY